MYSWGQSGTGESNGKENFTKNACAACIVFAESAHTSVISGKAVKRVTVKQRIAVALAVVALLAVLIFFVWYLQKPMEAPDGVLVYKEAYMRIAEQPWQGGRLCLVK